MHRSGGSRTRPLPRSDISPTFRVRLFGVPSFEIGGAAVSVGVRRLCAVLLAMIVLAELVEGFLQRAGRRGARKWCRAIVSPNRPGIVWGRDAAGRLLAFEKRRDTRSRRFRCSLPRASPMAR